MNIGFAYDAPVPEVDMLGQAINILPLNKKWACRHIFMSDDGALVAHVIQEKDGDCR